MPLPDNSRPRYLPHMQDPAILRMGLAPLGRDPWIETDADLPRYHAHKLAVRRDLGARCYRTLPASQDAQRELATLLRGHLLDTQGDHYRADGDGLRFTPAALDLPPPGDEPLWPASLWIADDLVVLQEVAGSYRVTAASLCSPSDWRLEEKFDRPLREVHAPIPGFDERLSPRVDRFFSHLAVEHPVVRHNWSLQAGAALCRRPGESPAQDEGALYYRTERQSLRRLPRTGAVVFTIRVYLHPLDCLRDIPGALPALFEAIDATPQALARYKRFDALGDALAAYR